MGLYRVLLVATIALLAATATSAVATHPKESTLISHDTPTAVHADSIATNERTHLRTNKISDNDDSVPTKSIENEERVALKELGMKIKRRMSFEFGLSDDYVKQLFGMKGLTGEKLTSHKNYKHYEWVRHKKEGQMMGKWLDRWSDDLTPRPTFKVWEHFGLEAMALRNVPLSDIKKTPGFASYERYVKGFDYYVMRWRKSSYPRKIQIPREASRTEMLAKAEIWGKTQMTDDYVLYALGLNKMSRERLAVNDDYNHVFKRFKEVQAEAKMKV